MTSSSSNPEPELVETEPAGTPIDPCCRKIQSALIGWLRLRNNTAVISNVFVHGSPWEADVIAVTSSFYYAEYEIKVSLADYRRDFEKRRYSWSKDGMRKHDAYASPGPVGIGRNGETILTKPSRFFFVTPVGMLSGVELPSHCGLLEFNPDERRHWGISCVKEAPRLKGPTKLSPEALFNLVVKASRRVTSYN